MTKSVPTALAASPTFKHPRLMALGDSLINGMQSMTIDGARAVKGPCALLARAIGYENVQVPDYRGRALIADVEAILRPLPQFGAALDLLQRKDAIFEQIQANALAWIEEALKPAETPTGPLFHDILGLSGATIDDVLKRTYTDWLGVIEAMQPAVAASKDPLKWSVGARDLTDLHMALNAVYLINPARLPREEFVNLTLCDLVAMREPEILITNMGANQGLFDFTLRGNPDKARKDLLAFAKGMNALADWMHALPSSVERVLFWTFPRPSQVPNQMPPPHDDHFYPAPAHGAAYHDEYHAALPLGAGFNVIDGGAMADADRFCDAIFERVSDVLAGTGDARLHVFDFASAFARYDYKHDHAKALIVPGALAASGQDTKYTNLAFDRSLYFVGPSFTGGLGSLDQHHPSSLGYQVLARELSERLAELGVPIEHPIEISDRGDGVLIDPPLGFFSLLEIWKNVGKTLSSTSADGISYAAIADERRAFTATVAGLVEDAEVGNDEKGAALGARFLTLLM